MVLGIQKSDKNGILRPTKPFNGWFFKPQTNFNMLGSTTIKNVFFDLWDKHHQFFGRKSHRVCNFDIDSITVWGTH
jgi:hypothetical protein